MKSNFMNQTLKKETQTNVATFYFNKRFFFLIAYIFMWTFFGWYFVSQKMNIDTIYFFASSNYCLFISFLKITAFF